MAETNVDGSPTAEDKSKAATARAPGKPNGKAALSASTEIEPLQEIYLNCEDPALWSGEGKGGKVVRNKPDDS